MKNGFVRDNMRTGFLQTDDAGIPKKHDNADISERHTATRRLCAGTYLDREFRQRLLRDIYNARERRVAPSYGYDLVQVLRHAWRAWWLELARDAVAVALFVTAVLTAPWGALLMVGLLAVWYALRACWRILVEAAQMLLTRKSFDHLRGLRVRAKLIVGGFLVSVIVAGSIVLAMLLNLEGSRLRDELVHAGLLVALFVLLFAVSGVVRQWQLDRLHNPSAVKSDPHSPRLRTLALQQKHPVTVYSGYRPFVGSGWVGPRWSFAQRIVRKREIGQDRDEEFPQSQPPFTTKKLVQHLKKSIQDLASATHSETRLPGLKVRDHVFIDGTYVNKVLEALSDPPPQTILDDIMAEPREEARYHIACQVEAWDGELVTTVFVHISLQGKTLYVEFSTYALLPTPLRFHVIDKVDGTGPKAALIMARKCLSELTEVLHSPRRLLAAPKHLANACWAQLSTKEKRGTEEKDGKRRDVIKRRDIGAQISAREIAGDSADNDHEETSYFQFFDVARHSKIVERRLLASIEDFLKTRGVDTSEFAKRAEAILNNGVLNTGSGNINISDSAIGHQSSVSNTTPAE